MCQQEKTLRTRGQLVKSGTITQPEYLLLIRLQRPSGIKDLRQQLVSEIIQREFIFIPPLVSLHYCMTPLPSDPSTGCMDVDVWENAHWPGSKSNKEGSQFTPKCSPASRGCPDLANWVKVYPGSGAIFSGQKRSRSVTWRRHRGSLSESRCVTSPALPKRLCVGSKRLIKKI